MQMRAFAPGAKAAGRPSASRRSSVSVRASADEARKWVENWQAKQGGGGASYDPNRKSWFPGNKLPAHLDGSLPGDFGFDPLGLGKEADKLRWYQQAELVHCRFAMLGAAGVLFPDLLHTVGLGGPAAALPWYDHAKFTYYAPISTLFGVQTLLFAWAELRRLQDIRKPGSASQDPIFTQYSVPAGEVGYPGGIFDPLGYAKNGDMAELKLKEIKNGRLAMLGCLGFAVQAYTTGTTPLANLGAHLANPYNTTVLTNEHLRLL